jgi:hypothetical protein
LPIAAIVPAHPQRVGGTLGAPPGIGDDGNRIRHADHAPHALERRDRSLVDRFECAAEHRALHDRSVKHVRQLDIDRVDRLGCDLLSDIESLLRRAGEFPGR